MKSATRQGRKEADELGEKINGQLEEVFKVEDAVQSIVKMTKESIDSDNSNEVNELQGR